MLTKLGYIDGQWQTIYMAYMENLGIYIYISYIYIYHILYHLLYQYSKPQYPYCKWDEPPSMIIPSFFRIRQENPRPLTRSTCSTSETEGAPWPWRTMITKTGGKVWRNPVWSRRLVVKRHDFPVSVSVNLFFNQWFVDESLHCRPQFEVGIASPSFQCRHTRNPTVPAANNHRCHPTCLGGPYWSMGWSMYEFTLSIYNHLSSIDIIHLYPCTLSMPVMIHYLLSIYILHRNKWIQAWPPPGSQSSKAWGYVYQNDGFLWISYPKQWLIIGRFRWSLGLFGFKECMSSPERRIS